MGTGGFNICEPVALRAAGASNRLLVKREAAIAVLMPITH